MLERATILFAGLSTATTPKIALIRHSLQQRFASVKTAGLVKFPEEGAHIHNFVVNRQSSVEKIFFAGIALLRMAAFLIKKSSRADLHYAINPPAGLLALMLKKLTGTPYIYEAHEIFCGFQNDIYGGKAKALWRFLERCIITNADYFFATDEFRLKFIRRYYRLAPRASSYLYNTAPSSDLGEGGKQPGLISYCGGIYPDREIALLIEALALADERAQLILAGGYDPQYKALLDQRIQEKGLAGRVTFTGPVSNQHIKQIMAQSQMTIAIYAQDCVNNRLCSPNKYFDAIMTGTFIVSSKSPLAKKLLVANRIGYTLEQVTAQGLAQAIDRYFQNMPDSSAPYAALSRQYSWQAEQMKLFTALESIH